MKEGKILSSLLLLKKGAKVNLQIGMKGTPLHMAIHLKHTLLIQVLLELGADPNAKDVHGDSPLHLVFKTFGRKPQKSAKIAGLLLKKGANPLALNSRLWSPIHYAC